MNQRIYVNYELLYKSLFAPGKLVTVQEIAEELYIETGVRFDSVTQVVTTLSLRYAIWSPVRGIYKIMESKDYEQYCKEDIEYEDEED